MAKADFNFMYNVTDTGGTFTLGELATKSVTVTDTKDGPGDNKKFLGDVADDQFKLSHAGSLNGTDYQFVSVGNIGNITGFVAKEGANYYFITDQNAHGDKGDWWNQIRASWSTFLPVLWPRLESSRQMAKLRLRTLRLVLQ